MIEIIYHGVRWCRCTTLLLLS